MESYEEKIERLVRETTVAIDELAKENGFKVTYTTDRISMKPISGKDIEASVGIEGCQYLQSVLSVYNYNVEKTSRLTFDILLSEIQTVEKRLNTSIYDILTTEEIEMISTVVDITKDFEKWIIRNYFNSNKKSKFLSTIKKCVEAISEKQGVFGLSFCFLFDDTNSLCTYLILEEENTYYEYLDKCLHEYNTTEFESLENLDGDRTDEKVISYILGVLKWFLDVRTNILDGGYVRKKINPLNY